MAGLDAELALAQNNPGELWQIVQDAVKEAIDQSILPSVQETTREALRGAVQQLRSDVLAAVSARDARRGKHGGNKSAAANAGSGPERHE